MTALVLSLAALPGAATAQTPRDVAVPAAIPSPSGPNRVGRLPFELVDSTRCEPTDSSRARVIPGWIWYPADRVAPSSASPNALERELPGEWGELRAAASAAKIGDPAAEAMKTISVHATTGARWAGAVGHAPVLVFTPGNGWLPTDYAVLLEDLASHGYVVVGVAPAGLADVVRLSDRRTIRKTLGIGPAIGEDQAHAHRDVLYVLARLAALDADEHAPWHHHLDLARVGAFGHSLGGTTALVAAATDTMVRAAINLDGDAMGRVTEVRPKQPLLFVSSELPAMREAPPALDSTWKEQAQKGIERSELRRSGEWANISSRAASATRIRILGTRHLNFTDAALASPLIEEPRLRWMKWGPIDGARGLRITADLVRAFFDHTLRGAPLGAPLLELQRSYGELRLLPNDVGATGAPHPAD